MTTPRKNPAAVALGRLGGLKGGKTKGATKARSSEQARAAAMVRWGGLKVESRECQQCANFKDLGPTQDNHCICTYHLMGVTRTMHVAYESSKGTCFVPRDSV